MHVVISLIIPNSGGRQLKRETMLSICEVRNSMSGKISTTTQSSADQTHPKVFLILTGVALKFVDLCIFYIILDE